MTDASHAGPADEGRTRRDFLQLATVAVAGFGTIAAIWPFIDTMNPDAGTLAAGGPGAVDLSKMAPGQQIVVRWRSRPIFIVRRSPEALKGLQDKQHLALLRDPGSSANQQPPYAHNWHRSEKPDYLVLVGICTHLGCIPEFKPQPQDPQLGADWPGGYFCPCHGSKYDLAGRVFKGVPAPLNLPVPPYHFVKGQQAVIRVGENPEGATWDFASIEQI